MEMHEDQQVFKLLSLLFQYPSPEWIYDEGLKEEISEIQDPKTKLSLTLFFEYLHSTPMEELTTTYVNTFDFNSKTTLYLTYVLFQDTKERGKALLKLKNEFKQAGVELLTDELPDYFPLLLEFAALAPQDIAAKLFRVNQKALTQLENNLKEINSPYCSLLAACQSTIKEFINKRQAS